MPSEGSPVLREPERASVRLCSVCELGILTLTDCDQAPFEGPAIVIPPALPDAYSHEDQDTTESPLIGKPIGRLANYCFRA